MSEFCKNCSLGPCSKGRKCDGLSEVLDSLSRGDTTDWYHPSATKTGGNVSIEDARFREKILKDALDDAVVDENRYSSYEGRVKGEGSAPCRIIRKRSWG